MTSSCVAHVFCIDVLFFKETEFTKFVSEQIATGRARDTSRLRRIPMPAAHWRRSSRCGNNGNGVHRGSQRRRIRRVGLQRLGGHAPMHRILRTRREYPGVIIAAHKTRVREDLMTFSMGILELAATRNGTSLSPLPRRGKNPGVRAPARDVVVTT